MQNFEALQQLNVELTRYKERTGRHMELIEMVDFLQRAGSISRADAIQILLNFSSKQ